MTRIKFYAHKVFPGTEDFADMFRSITIVSHTVQTVCEIFNGISVYTGNGSESVQYNDTVEFKELSDIHLEAILRNYPFASKVEG